MYNPQPIPPNNKYNIDNLILDYQYYTLKTVVFYKSD